MATAGGAGEDLRKELSCSICLDYFTEAVILKCGHNYCRGCILTHWDETGDDYSGYQCPQCRAVFNKKTFTKNYLVQNLVAKLDDLDLEALGGSSSSSSSRPARSAKPLQIDGKCEQHGEELKLFCETDGRPICVVCRESRAHRHHEVAPMHEVVHDMKMELQLRLLELNWQKSRCTSVRLEDERTKNDLKLKKQRLKEKIEADVGALVQFLLDERDALLDGLDAEELATTAVLDDNQKTVDAEVAAVDATIAQIRDHVAGKTSFESLVKSYNEAINCKQFNTMESVNCPSDWTDFSGPFQLIVWKKMMHVLHTMPQNLTLDPDTAHPNLLITDFDTQVEEGRACVHEPDLPSRFTRFFSVLATASYGGGQHYWEVDVRDKGVWYLGVTAESSNRKGFVSLAPSAGYWSLCLQDRLYANGENGRIPVADYWNSPRVGIYLDYDNGRLCFYDAVTMKKLYMFSTRFEEPVCPFFSPGKNDPGSRLQICHYY